MSGVLCVLYCVCVLSISMQGSSISAVSIILYTFVAAILVMFFQRLLARYIFRG